MIRLQRNIDIQSFDLEATVAVAAHRPEYLAVLQLAADLQRPLDAGTIHRELFGDLPDSLGRIVLDRCILLGLFDREKRGAPAHLTDAGRAALDRGDILIEEEGLWRVYYLDDPLLGRRLMHALPLDDKTTAQDVRNQLKKDNKKVRTASAGLPALVREVSGNGITWASIVDNRAFELREPGMRGEAGPGTTLRLSLDWPEDRAMDLSLRGNLPLDGKQVRVDQHIDIPEDVQSLTYHDLWLALVSLATNVPRAELLTWHTHTGQSLLPQSFTELSEATRRTMRRDLEIPAHRHTILGTFEATKLTGLSIVPRRNSDAQEWAEWLEWDALSTYAVPDLLRARSSEIAAKFPYHRPTPRTPDALLKHATMNPSDHKSRFLLAPADLGLWS